MRRLLLLSSLVLVVVLCGASAGVVFAQSQDKPGTLPSAADVPAGTTVTGCLVKGEQAGQFQVQVSKSKKVEVSATEDLNTNLNKQVRVTGSMESVSGKSVFKATKVEVLANTCPADGD